MIYRNRLLKTTPKAKTEALALKLRCLELEVLNATYTKDSVAALRKETNSN